MPNQPLPVYNPEHCYWIARFHQYVPSKPPTACWPWEGRKTSRGGGLFNIRVMEPTASDPGIRARGAHRIAWEIHYGRRLAQMEALVPTCENRLCCNPRHWYKRTINVVQQELLRRGKHHLSTITVEQAREIATALRTEAKSQREIAEQYGITPSEVSQIKHGKRWGWATGIDRERRPSR